MKLRDKFWLWGHPEGCYNNMYGNTGISRMTPMECSTQWLTSIFPHTMLHSNGWQSTVTKLSVNVVLRIRLNRRMRFYFVRYSQIAANTVTATSV